MGKKRKRSAASLTGGGGGGSSSPGAPPDAVAEGNATIALRAADVETTIATLNILAKRPDLLASKALRDLRTALHPLVEEQLKRYDPIDYAARVTAALRAGRGADALLALQGMHARQQIAKQGAVQRWVRDCDSFSDAGMRVQLLRAILRAGKPVGTADAADTTGAYCRVQDDDDVAAGDGLDGR